VSGLARGAEDAPTIAVRDASVGKVFSTLEEFLNFGSGLLLQQPDHKS